MLNDGADILDIGGQSTRPGAQRLSVTEEYDRVIPIIESVHERFPAAVISIDSFHAKIATEGVAAGASIVNDISAGRVDNNMISSVGALSVPYICMHMKGEPETMQRNPSYENIFKEVLDFFVDKKNECQKAGINDLIIDPGFGFGKTIRHNFELLNQIDMLSMLNCPIMVGISRKSTIYKTIGVTANEALNGTTVLNTIALLKGASILRVHDVKEAKQVVKLVSALKSEKLQSPLNK